MDLLQAANWFRNQGWDFSGVEDIRQPPPIPFVDTPWTPLEHLLSDTDLANLDGLGFDRFWLESQLPVRGAAEIAMMATLARVGWQDERNADD